MNRRDIPRGGRTMDYDRTTIASTYDAARGYRPEVMARWLDLVAAHAPPQPKLVLDAGCGTGRFTGPLAERFGARVIGIDPSERMLAEARRKAEGGGQVEFMQELPAWRGRWGVLIEHIAERETKYRFDEVERESEGTGWTLYAERRLGENWRIHAEVTDLLGRGFVQVRDSFAGPRSDAPLEERETRHRTTPGVFALTLRRSFGG